MKFTASYANDSSLEVSRHIHCIKCKTHYVVKTKLEPNHTYVAYPLDNKKKKNFEREVQIRTFDISSSIDGVPQIVQIKYLDNKTVGKADIQDLYVNHDDQFHGVCHHIQKQYNRTTIKKAGRPSQTEKHIRSELNALVRAADMIAFRDRILSTPKDVLDAIWPIDIILSTDNLSALKVIEQNGFDISTYMVPNTSISFAKLAVSHGATKCMQYSMAKIKDLEELSSHGVTLLMYAAKKGNASIVRTLLQQKVNFKASDMKKHTAVSYAALEGHHECVRMLAERGAKINPTHSNGHTLLEELTEEIKHYDVIEYLMSKVDKQTQTSIQVKVVKKMLHYLDRVGVTKNKQDMALHFQHAMACVGIPTNKDNLLTYISKL